MFGLKRVGSLLLTGILAGIGLSFLIKSPYVETAALSKVVLVLSGSSWDSAMQFHSAALVDFTLRILPILLLELYLGLDLYRFFCTASIYIFSRITDRASWFRREALTAAFYTLLANGSLLFGVVSTSFFLYQLIPDVAGWMLCFVHLILYSLWTYFFVMLIVLLAIPFGSTMAYSFTICVQGGMIALLLLLSAFDQDSVWIERLLPWNPVAHIILGWHSAWIPSLAQALDDPLGKQSLVGSILFLTLACFFVFYLLERLIQRYDMISESVEMGG